MEEIVRSASLVRGTVVWYRAQSISIGRDGNSALLRKKKIVSARVIRGSGVKYMSTQ